jgi:hypothetical protein
MGAIALAASLAMTAVYHAGYTATFPRQDAQAGNRRPRLKRADAQPDRRAGGHLSLYVGAVVHNHDTDLFPPPY